MEQYPSSDINAPSTDDPNNPHKISLLSGAGGPWPRFDEQVDPSVVCQFGNLWCGPACAVMILKDTGVGEVDQQDVGRLSGAPTGTKALAAALNALASFPDGRWLGGPVEIPGALLDALLPVLCRTGSWSAMLWPPTSAIGHFVVVDALDLNNQTLDIRDPWPPGTAYRMNLADFVNYWSGEAVFRR
jgi:hypothetical protein